MNYLTLGTVWKQEEAYALDFILLHKSLGVEKFIILDREYGNLKNLLKDEPNVEIIHFPENGTNVHAEGWAQLIGMNKGKTKWLALIDADQALVPVKKNNIKEVLSDYEDVASLQVNWHTFGSGKQDKKLPGSLYERFTFRAKSEEGINNHTQFICQPDRTLAEKTADPHHPKLPSNEISVNTNKNPVSGPFNCPPLHDVLWCAHYINKSREEFIIKNAKGRADIFGEKMPFELFDAHENIANVEKETRVLELWNKNIERI